MASLLTLNQVAEHPSLLARRITVPSGREYDVRPITVADEAGLRDFLTRLADRTRRFYSIGRNARAAAAEWCCAIAVYDKLRLLVADGAQVVGIVEFSMDLPPGDLERFRSHGYRLDPRMDCRFALCIADELQGQGLGSGLLPLVWEIARGFGRTRIILWGGVMIENTRALEYYRKSGFQEVGEFVNSAGAASLDMVLED
jgi:GNAT superfamily N-acetyltransferase